MEPEIQSSASIQSKEKDVSNLWASVIDKVFHADIFNMGKHIESEAARLANGPQNRLAGRKRDPAWKIMYLVVIVGLLGFLELTVLDHWWGSGISRFPEITSPSQIFSESSKLTHGSLRQALTELSQADASASGKKPQICSGECAASKDSRTIEQQLKEGKTPADQHILTRIEKQYTTLPTRNHTKNELLGFVPGNTFLPLKDVKQPAMSDKGTNWFMSGLRSGPPAGSGETFDLPLDDPKERVICVSGNHRSDGTKNSYGLFNKEDLPPNSTFLSSITFIADNFWDYGNPWHAMSALVNFVTWRMENRCLKPERLLLYHRGELVTSMGPWITHVLQASFSRAIPVQTIDDGGNSSICFERAVIQRQGLGAMDKPHIHALFDMIRCRTRKYCGLEPPAQKSTSLELLLLTRSGPRAFKDEGAVAEIVKKECMKVAGCNLRVMNIGGLTFCKQVEVMSRTDVLITVHGAQLTNMMFMLPGSRMMEMFPKGWLEFAGIGQEIYKWHADWNRIIHEGRWRDPEGPDCPSSHKETLKCFLFFKDREVGLNATFLAEWTGTVLNKFTAAQQQKSEGLKNSRCPCEEEDSGSR